MKLEIGLGKKLTKREKKLLMIVAVVGPLLLMVQFVILPLNDELADKSAELVRLTDERMDIEMTIAQEPLLRIDFDDAIVGYRELRDTLLSEYLSNEVGREITTLVEGHGFIALSQDITPHENFIREGITASSAAITTTTITQTIRGPYDNLTSLMDSVEEISYVRITRVAFNFEEDEDGHAATDTITVTFEITMLKDGIVDEEILGEEPAAAEEETDSGSADEQQTDGYTTDEHMIDNGETGEDTGNGD